MARPAWVTSVRRRPAGAASLVVLSALAVLISVLAPMLLRAVQQQGLAEATALSHVDDMSLVVVSDLYGDSTLVGTSNARDVVESVEVGPVWRAPVVAAESAGDVPWASTSDPDVTGGARVASLLRDDCGDTVLDEGVCPVDEDQVMVSSDTDGVVVGDRIVATTDLGPVELTVSGRYDPAQGDGRFFAAPSRAVRVDEPGAADLVVTSEGFDSLLLAAKVYAALVPSRALALDDVARVRADAEALEEATLGTDGAAARAQLTSSALDVLARVDRQADAAAVIAAATALQALALAWFGVALVVQRLARVRSAEWGLARLRGLPRGRWLAAVFTEPALAVVLGAVLGALAGWGCAVAATRAWLGDGVPVEPTSPLVVGAASLALVGSLVALGVASLRSARVPLDQLLGGSADPRRLGRLGVVVQAGLALVTVTVLVALVTQGEATGPGIALLAPSLVAVLVGVGALRLIALLAGRSARRPPRSLTALLVTRRLGRTPSVLTAAVLVCLGVAVTGWATQVAVTADRLQVDRARASVGASTALTVSVRDDVPFVDAVRAVDPEGDRAMAVDVLRRGQGVGRIVAVDTARLGAVSAWPSDWSTAGTPDRLAELLAPPVGDSFELTGSSVSLDVSGVTTIAPQGLTLESFPTDLADVSLRLVVQADDGWHTVDLGDPRDGIVTSVPGRFPCEAGCRVVWLGATSSRATTPTFGVALTVTGISTDQQSTADTVDWLAADRWRDRIGEAVDPTRPATTSITEADGGVPGLDLSFLDQQGGNTASIAPRDAPEPLPVVVADGTSTTPFAGLDGGVVGVAPDLTSRVLAQVGHARILPRIGGEGILVDLPLLDRVSDPGASDAQHEVWLAPMSAAEEARVVSALSDRGVEVVATRTLQEVTDGYRHASPTRASSLALVVGAAALLLTLAATVAARVVSAPSRRGDRTALESAGVPRRRLRRAAALEVFLPPAVGTVLGGAAGLVAYLLTVSRLPLVVGSGRVPPPDLVPSWGPLALLVVGTLALLAGVAGVAGRVEVGRGHDERTPR
jgi:putative ABC transport system permease protein